MYLIFLWKLFKCIINVTLKVLWIISTSPHYILIFFTLFCSLWPCIVFYLPSLAPLFSLSFPSPALPLVDLPFNQLFFLPLHLILSFPNFLPHLQPFIPLFHHPFFLPFICSPLNTFLPFLPLFPFLPSTLSLPSFVDILPGLPLWLWMSSASYFPKKKKKNFLISGDWNIYTSNTTVYMTYKVEPEVHCVYCEMISVLNSIFLSGFEF